MHQFSFKNSQIFYIILSLTLDIITICDSLLGNSILYFVSEFLAYFVREAAKKLFFFRGPTTKRERGGIKAQSIIIHILL